jgi:competence protein ComEC
MNAPPARPRAPRRLLLPAIGAWAAAAAGTLTSPRVGVAIAATVSGIALVLGRRSTLIALLALGVVAGSVSAAWHVRALRVGIVPALARRHAETDLIARLVRDPVATTASTGAPLTVVDATVTAVLDGGWRPSNAPILVLSYATAWPALLPGQRVELTGRLSPPRHGDSVAAVLDARAPPLLVGRPPWWQRAAGRVRAALRRACWGLPSDEQGLVPGLVDGDTAAVPPSLQTAMRLTGLTHLEAVSGENVSIVLGVTLAIARGIGLRRRTRVVVSALALLAFVVLARPSPSVLRAAVTGTIALLAMASGRRIAAIPALSAAVLVLVCVDPFLARSVGFVLSVCATAAILVVAPGWTRRLARYLPETLAAMIAVPAAAQIACTPVLVLAFGQLTPYAVLANLLAAPVVPLATVLGVICAVVATMWAPPAVVIAWAAAVPAAVVAVVARLLAGLPGAGLPWPGGAPAVVVSTIGGAALMWLRRGRAASSRHAMLAPWPP